MSLELINHDIDMNPEYNKKTEYEFSFYNNDSNDARYHMFLTDEEKVLLLQNQDVLINLLIKAMCGYSEYYVWGISLKKELRK